MDLDIEATVDDHLIPPKPPDDPMQTTTKGEKPTYSDTLVKATAQNDPNSRILHNPLSHSHMQTNPMVENDLVDCIAFTQEEKQRIYSPWLHSVIIKLLGKRLHHQYLNEKLQKLWKLDEVFPLIDLGEDFYIAKFHKHESLHKVLTAGPWFVNGFFLSVRCWEPNFVATQIKLLSTAIWIRLPNLPTEFFDEGVLRKIGSSLGKLLKVDFKTSTALRARYARICIEVQLDTPVKSFVLIEHHKQKVLYEGDNILCKVCGRLSHIQEHCPYKTQIDTPSPNPTFTPLPQLKLKSKEGDSEWHTVTFLKRKNSNSHKSYTMPNNSSNVRGNNDSSSKIKPAQAPCQ